MFGGRLASKIFLLFSLLGITLVSGAFTRFQKSSTSAAVACASTDPGIQTSTLTICTGVTEAAAMGWRMQGGVIVGKDPMDSSKWLVMTSASQGSKAWSTTSVDVASLTNVSTYTTALASTEYATAPVITEINNTNYPAFNYCETLTTNGASGWHLTNAKQLLKGICNTAMSASFSPYCVAASISSSTTIANATLNMTASSAAAYWILAENTSANAWSLRLDGSSMDAIAKTSTTSPYSMATRCVRQF